jgi:Phage phiEco32-like COOH.NH2 ligase-type 2
MGGITFGSDPELIIVKSDSEELKSAIKVLKGHGKYNKLPITASQAMFYDNVLLEFNVDPAHTLAEFRTNLLTCLDFANKVLAEQGCRLETRASATFPESECDDEDAFVFGCDPEYCIYNLSPQGAILPVKPPSLPKGNTFRSCGGHIHLGHPIATVDRGNPPMVVRLMDAFLGATSLLIDQDKSSGARRKLYGGAGTHRITPYGLEYRTLSNFWLNSPMLVEIIYKLTRMVVQLALVSPKIVDSFISPKELQDLINNGRVGDAKALYEKTSKVLPRELQALIEQAQAMKWQSLEFEWEEQKQNIA